MNISGTFEDRLKKYKTERQRLKASHTQISWLRVLLFIGGIIAIVLSANAQSGPALLISSVIFVGSFLILMKKHTAVKWQLKFKEALFSINETELKRLKGDINSLPDGIDHFQPNHPYHIDLDIFGKHSLFQLINRTTTKQGENLFAKWLSAPDAPSVVRARQQAVAELAKNLDWRQEFEASGRTDASNDSDTKGLNKWLGDRNRMSSAFYQISMYLLPVATVAAIVASALGFVQVGLPVLLIFINIGVLLTVFKRALDIHKLTEKSNDALKALERMIQMIESSKFESPLLQEVQQRLLLKNQKASAVIKELQVILDNLHNRANQLYHLFNIIFLLDIFWLVKAEKWKEKTKVNVLDWFDAIAEMECLNSLAGFHYAHPEYAFAEFTEEPFFVESTRLGHPLIKENGRVSNDFSFSGRGGICLITGSNMSGKSTFLRTVGINAVLAQMGAPVCATSFKLSPFRVFTSMRTTDDLEESVSSFYAELKRLKQLLGSIDSEAPLLFMIDEVLKGTNSVDRHKGAIALIKQLNKSHAFGFVSTHDLELGGLTQELEGVKNYSFNSEIIDNEIIFDYTLTEGLCKSFNATKLMQQMGIEIIE